jgi:hypothetical protein
MNRPPIHLLLPLLAFLGCASGEAKHVNDLKAMGLAFVSFCDDNKQGPANWEELIEYAKKVNLFPESIERVREKGYTVVWEINLQDVDPSTTVIAKPPDGKGYQLYGDGSVR